MALSYVIKAQVAGTHAALGLDPTDVGLAIVAAIREGEGALLRDPEEVEHIADIRVLGAWLGTVHVVDEERAS